MANIIDFLTQAIDWIEKHRVTTGLIQWGGLLIIAWVTGVFRLLGRYATQPKLELVHTASFAFIEELGSFEGLDNCVRISFCINASIINSSNEKVVLDRFYLSFQTHSFWRNYRQRLLRLNFPSRPRIKRGQGYKFAPVYFTSFPGEENILAPDMGVVASKEISSGYLLFVSFTYGSWNPKIKDEYIRVKLTAKLTTGDVLIASKAIRIERSKEFVEDFCPGFINHISEVSTWNHDLSVLN